MQEAYASYVKDYYLGQFGASVLTYDQQHLKNTTPGVGESGNMLTWAIHLTCVAMQVKVDNLL